MKYLARATTLMVISFLTGCAGIVGGELARVDQTAVAVPVCDVHAGPTPYYFEVDSGSGNDYMDENPAGWLSGWTFGLLPTYWLSPVHAQARLYHQNVQIARYQYGARVHKFYGLLWALPLVPINALVADYNEVPANEGLGLMVGPMIVRKAKAQAYLDAIEKRGLAPDEVCYQQADRKR